MVAGDMAGACAIGVDLGGTKLLAGVVDDDLRVHHRTQRLVPRGDTARLLDVVREAVEEARAAASAPVAGVGFGIACLLDRRRGVAVSSVHLPIEDVAFGDVMRERIGLPVEVDNDANAAMLAEWRAGAAQGAEDAVMLTIGTGIGGGLVVGGRLARGAIGAGAELGHVTIDFDGPPCPGNCPNRGCLEAYVSGEALARDGFAAGRREPSSGLGRALASGRRITGPLVTELAWDGDEAARAIITRCGERLGAGLASLVNIFNPTVVVIGGGVIAAGEMLLEPARASLAQRALRPARDIVELRPARFGDEAGMLGAAAMALEATGHLAPVAVRGAGRADGSGPGAGAADRAA
jgi:glucokinase